VSSVEKYFSHKTIDQLAKKTGFVKRSRKLPASSFVNSLMFSACNQGTTSSPRQVANGQSVASVARSLGISEALLYQWRHRSKEVDDPFGNEQKENLRKQVKQLEAERDILKKALAIFSRPI
jgi:transposase